jgi:biopolymer transport protein ExbB/TolQ
LEGTAPGRSAAAATILTLFAAIPLLLVYRVLRRQDSSLL